MLQILRKKRNYESQFDHPPPPPSVVFPKIIFYRKGYSPVPNNRGGSPTDNLNIKKQGGLNKRVKRGGGAVSEITAKQNLEN